MTSKWTQAGSNRYGVFDQPAPRPNTTLNGRSRQRRPAALRGLGRQTLGSAIKQLSTRAKTVAHSAEQPNNSHLYAHYKSTDKTAGVLESSLLVLDTLAYAA